MGHKYRRGPRGMLNSSFSVYVISAMVFLVVVGQLWVHMHLGANWIPNSVSEHETVFLKGSLSRKPKASGRARRQRNLSPNLVDQSPSSLLQSHLDSLSHNEFGLVQRAVMANVSAQIKLKAIIGARYMDELIIWSENDKERQNCRDTALQFYATAEANDPMNPFIPYRMGALLWLKQDYNRSLEKLGVAMFLAMQDESGSNEPLLARVSLFMGKCWEGLSPNWDQRSQTAYERAVAWDPSLAPAHHELALLLYSNQKWEETVDHLRVAMWLDPYREKTTPLMFVNDYQGHEYVPYTNAIVFELARARKTLWEFQTKSVDQEVRERALSLIRKPVHLVFCINTGRSGSHFLATLFRTLDGDSYGFHEPMPQTHWHERTLEEPMEASFMDRLQKVSVIKKFLATAPPGSTYTETSLNFITQFYDVIINEFRPPKYKLSVIILRRDLAKILKSVMDVGWFDETMLQAGEQWDRWTHSLNSANAVLEPLGPDENLTRYEKAIGYLIDIEARAQKFKETYPDVNVIEVDLEDLNDRAKLDNMLNSLGLKGLASEHTYAHLGQRTNNKDTSKGVATQLNSAAGKSSNTYEECVAQIEQYLQKCRDQQIKVPPLPHFRSNRGRKDPSSRLRQIVDGKA